MDGGFIHAKDQKSRGESWFEVIAGKSMPEEGAAKCFAYVQTYDTKPKRRLFELMKSQGLQANQQVTFLSDGADDVRELPLYLSPESEHWLDWFHVAMRLRVMGQMAKGLVNEQNMTPAHMPPTEDGHVVMQEFFSRVSNFFLDCLPQASLGEVPPERLPRRAVQGFGGAQPPSNRFVLVPSFSRRSIGSLKRSASKRLDASGQGVTKLELAAQRGAQHHGELVEFESEAFVGFQRGGRVAREQVPDLDQEFAGHGGDGDIAVAFSGEEFPAPLAQEPWRGPLRKTA